MAKSVNYPDKLEVQLPFFDNPDVAVVFSNYDQIRNIVSRLSHEDKLRLANELIAETRKSKLEYFPSIFRRDEAANELPSMEEIQAEVDAVRQELYEKRKRG